MIVLANLLPVLGVACWGWSAVEAFTVYAMETLIIGILTVLKLLVATLSRKGDQWYNGSQTTRVSGVFFIFFFVVHFGVFAAVQTSIFSAVARLGPPGAGPLYFFLNWYKFINEHTGYALAAFVVSYFANNFIPFILSGDYKNTPMMMLMFQPYGRIIIQQFTVILGSMMLVFNFGIGFMTVFVLAKLYLELFVNFESILNKTVDDMKKDG